MKVDLLTRDYVRDLVEMSREKKRMTEISGDRGVKDRLDERYESQITGGCPFVFVG